MGNGFVRLSDRPPYRKGRPLIHQPIEMPPIQGLAGQMVLGEQRVA